MPATSGSPTQIATSAATPAALAGTPIDAFKEGDQGWVVSLQKLFVLKRGTAPYAANNTTLVAGFGGEGYWADANDANFWAAVTTWFVDPVGGDDDNTGTTSLAPLQTFGELYERLAGATDVVTATVTVMSSSASTSDSPKFASLPPGSVVSVVGELDTQLGTGTLTAVQAINRAANDAMEIEAAALGGTWTALGYVGWLIRNTTAGARFGTVAFVMQDLGGANNRARITPMLDLTTQTIVTPQVGDTFEVVQLSSIAAHPSIVGENWAFTVTFRYLRFADTTYDYAPGKELAAVTTFEACRISNWLQMVDASDTTFIGCGFITTATPEVYDSARATCRFCGFVGANAYISNYSPTGKIRLRNDTMLLAGSVAFMSAGGYIETTDLAVFDNNFDVILSQAPMDIRLYNAIYGENNTNQIVYLSSYSTGIYTNLAQKTVASTVPVLSFAGTTKAWADLPFVDSLVSQAGLVLNA